MHRLLFLASAFLFAGCPPPVVEPSRAPPLVDLVDPTIGNGGFAFAYGATFLGAAVPHGLMTVGPDTTGNFGEIAFIHTSGSWAEDPTILCFSHLHLHGVGLPEGGVLAMMPTTSFDATKPNAVAYKATRVDEKAKPGSYAVTLQEPNIRVELAAAAHSASWRVTYPDGTADAVVVLDLFRTLTSGTVTEAHHVVDGQRITGSLHTNGGLSPPGGYDVYFTIDAADPFTATDTDIGAGLSFGPRDAAHPVELHVAISYVDADGADQNLAHEIAHDTKHDAVVAAAHDAWDAVLGRVRLFGGSNDEHVMFASALYRSFLMPTAMSDVDGRFRLNGAVQSAVDANGKPFRMMTDLSLWDTYRSVHQLYALLAPASARDGAVSIAQWTKSLGAGPLWPMATGDASVMVGSPGEVVLGDALVRGVVDAADVGDAYGILRDNALDMSGDHPNRGGRSDVVAYDHSGGWVPVPAAGAVSKTLEYAVADQGLARLATALGHDDDASKLTTRSHGWRDLFDGDTGFLRGKNADGTFAVAAADFVAEHFSDDYVEADAWQSQFPLDDVDGIAAVYGGKDGAVAKLRTLLDNTKADWATRDPSSATFGINPLPFHWQGNEPSEHVAALAYRLGDDALAAEFVRFVMTTQYNTSAAGLPGNDDGGALSSWWALAAMGLFAVPGSDTWTVGAPLFPKVEVDTPAGTLTITRTGNGAAPAARTLDGTAVDADVSHAQLIGAHTLDVSCP